MARIPTSASTSSAVGAAPLARTSLADLPGLGRVFRELVRHLPADPAGAAGAGRGRDPGAVLEAAALSEFERVLVAVAGTPGALGAAMEAPAPPDRDGTARGAPSMAGRSLDDYRRAIAGEAPIVIPTDRRVAARDESAYRLLSLGYSAREIADILAGRISRAALDDAQKMLMLGTPAEKVSDFLDRAYRRIADAAAAGAVPGRRPGANRSGRRPGVVPRATTDAVVRAAARYGIPADLVRAVITCESDWDPAARSAAGAIGLMQLMPGTARELGVDPHDPVQNVDGGTRYLAGLLVDFGSIERALVAYNAGPGFATRFLRGEAALYGETRAFVRRVLAMLGR
jgi:soluble lytic murein transglycosylase-like protein